MYEDLIVEQNPWWRRKEEIGRDKKVREAFSKNHKLLFSFKEKENKIIFGPRQVGKTTFLKLLIYDLINKGKGPKKIFYFGCETLKDFNELLKVLNTAERITNPKYIFFDEISFVENWERAIKYILDQKISEDKIFYFTGSSSVALKKERFPGRSVKKQEFLPLSFKEFLLLFGSKELKKEIKSVKLKELSEIRNHISKLIPHKKEIDTLFYKYLWCGGFPKSFYELVEEGEIKEETYDAYWQWVIGDVLKLERSEKICIGVLTGILKNYTTKFSLNSLSKEVEMASHITVRDYLELLENLFVIRNFYTYDPNKKRVVYRKMRKVYFIDPFLYRVFQKKIFMKMNEDYERIVEGLVSEAIIRFVNNPLKVGFYHNRKEVDVMFTDCGIEVKWKEKITEKDFPKVDIRNKIIVSKDDLKLGEILIIPASVFLSLV